MWNLWQRLLPSSLHWTIRITQGGCPYIRDMMILSEKQPGVLAEFKAGKFVIYKTSNKFSTMAIEQCHEQNNAFTKGSGGAIGLTENIGAQRRWTGPEIGQII